MGIFYSCNKTLDSKDNLSKTKVVIDFKVLDILKDLGTLNRFKKKHSKLLTEINELKLNMLESND
ncbi:MAG: hypothetical protein GY718_09415 [Lentisphaerae bacterium]|nr:hypothetical protein [Lentisphaerota bacterium]